MTTYHKDLNGPNVHSVIWKEFNDAASRISEAGLSAADIGKLAWQKSDDTFWVLKNHVGPAWSATGAPFGTTAGTTCEGNDSRLSDARTPVAHNQDASSITSGIFNVDRIPNLDASTITSGTIDLARLPAAALDRLIIVSDEATRFALTTTQVQLGDTVKQTTPSGIMYRVVDDTKLSEVGGYVEYSAARAAAVDWSGVENKPSTFIPSYHTHIVTDITLGISNAKLMFFSGF